MKPVRSMVLISNDPLSITRSEIVLQHFRMRLKNMI